MPELDRRTFLGASAFALASGIAEAADPPEWFDRPMRWAQLTLVEDDPGQFDSKFWLDYFRRTHADAACLSAGGCVAYYPTKIPLHYRSAVAGRSDPFGDLVAGCRKLGMEVIARTDPHAGASAMYATRIRIGSRWMPRASSGAIWACPSCGSHARWVLTTSSS